MISITHVLIYSLIVIYSLFNIGMYNNYLTPILLIPAACILLNLKNFKKRSKILLQPLKNSN